MVGGGRGCYRVLGPAALPSAWAHLWPWGAALAPLSNASPFYPMTAPQCPMGNRNLGGRAGAALPGMAPYCGHRVAQALRGHVGTAWHGTAAPAPPSQLHTACIHPLPLYKYVGAPIHMRATSLCKPADTRVYAPMPEACAQSCIPHAPTLHPQKEPHPDTKGTSRAGKCHQRRGHIAQTHVGIPGCNWLRPPAVSPGP